MPEYKPQTIMDYLVIEADCPGAYKSVMEWILSRYTGHIVRECLMWPGLLGPITRTQSHRFISRDAQGERYLTGSMYPDTHSKLSSESGPRICLPASALCRAIYQMDPEGRYKAIEKERVYPQWRQGDHLLEHLVVDVRESTVSEWDFFRRWFKSRWPDAKIFSDVEHFEFVSAAGSRNWSGPAIKDIKYMNKWELSCYESWIDRPILTLEDLVKGIGKGS